VGFALFHNAVPDCIANNSLHASTWETTIKAQTVICCSVYQEAVYTIQTYVTIYL